MINSYHFKPAPVFCLGSGETFPMELRSSEKYSVLIGRDEKRNFNSYRVPFYGVEIEIEDITDEKISASVWGAIQKINALNFYIKHDSSLQNGLELVSHPRSFKNWVENAWKLKDLFSTLRKYKLLGSSRRCGLHVHIGWSAFSSTTHVMRFVRLMQEMQFPLIMHQQRKDIQSFMQYATPSYNGDRSTFYLLRDTTMLAGPMSCSDILRNMAYSRRQNNTLTEHHSFLSFTENTLEVRGFPGASSIWQLYKSLYVIEAIREYTFNHGLKRCTLKDLELWLLNHHNKFYRLFGRKLKAFTERDDIRELIELYEPYTGGIIILGTAADGSNDLRSQAILDKRSSLSILKEKSTNDNRYSSYTNIKIRKALEKLETLGFFPGFVGARRAETERLYSYYLPSEIKLGADIEERTSANEYLDITIKLFRKFNLFGLSDDDKEPRHHYERILKEIYSDTSKMFGTLSPYEKTLAILCYYSDDIFLYKSKEEVDELLLKLTLFFERELEDLLKDTSSTSRQNKYKDSNKGQSIYSDHKNELMRLYSTAISKADDYSFYYYWGSLGVYNQELKNKLVVKHNRNYGDINRRMISILRDMKKKVPAFIRNGCNMNEELLPKKPMYSITGTSTFITDTISYKVPDNEINLNEIAMIKLNGECLKYKSSLMDDDNNEGRRIRRHVGLAINPFDDQADGRQPFEVINNDETFILDDPDYDDDEEES